MFATHGVIGGFFGLGADVTGVGIQCLPYWVLLPIAGVSGAIMAALVGLATLWLSGVYFVIVTLGHADFIRQIITWGQNVSGTKGLYLLTSITERDICWQLLRLTALVWGPGWLIGRSRLGFALRIIGDDETVARHSGINTAHARILRFMVPGAVVAITGAVLAITPMRSFQMVIMALLGGNGRLWGPLAGVIPFTFLWEAISVSFPNQTTLVL